MYRFIIAILFLSISFCASAQRITVDEYIEQYKYIAISEMKRSGIPAAVTLAQGILETENGNGDLVKRSNNHFGIKCKNTWTGETVYHDDDATGECFRAYVNAADSYRDHSDFLRSNKRYDFLFRLDAKDYKGWAYGLKKAGYATNPRYPNILIKNIEDYNLQQYTLAGINEIPDFDVIKIKEDDQHKLPPEVKADDVINSNNIVVGTGAAEKIIIINKTKCVFAKKGTSLLAIADKYNISLKKIMECNELTEEGILNNDQFVFLQKKQKTGEKEYYIVQPGETLYDVAQQNGIQLKFLKEYNNLNAGEILPAHAKLYLQDGFRSSKNNIEESKNKIHLVAPKEGLYTIARKYSVTVQQLREWNDLETDELRIGQEIIVSKNK